MLSRVLQEMRSRKQKLFGSFFKKEHPSCACFTCCLTQPGLACKILTPSGGMSRESSPCAASFTHSYLHLGNMVLIGHLKNHTLRL
jgi:hypothetical protein